MRRGTKAINTKYKHLSGLEEPTPGHQEIERRRGTKEITTIDGEQQWSAENISGRQGYL